MLSAGVNTYGVGGVSSLPVIRGLADDRIRIKVDGMDLIASCPNHMNPPLSYIDPTNVGTLRVYSGITPVSVGGDSIAGTIIAETLAPVFAAPGQDLLTTGRVGGFYRSNGNAWGANIAATAATENISLTYTGSSARADNYTAGGNFKTTAATGRVGHTLPLDEVGSTAYESLNQMLSIALKGGDHLVEAKFGFQHIPEQLYPNQRMDMLDNEQKTFNLRYLGQFDWGLFVVLQYANQSAELYGIDVSGRIPLASTDFGDFGLTGSLAYTHGQNLDTDDGLYNIMPLNGKLALTHAQGGWKGEVEVVAVAAKDDVSDVRNEVKTAGYGLANLRGSYTWKQVRMDLGVDNLFEKFYSLPLGGAYVGQGTTMALNPGSGKPAWGTAVPGMGRSIYTGLTQVLDRSACFFGQESPDTRRGLRASDEDSWPEDLCGTAGRRRRLACLLWEVEVCWRRSTPGR